MTRTLRRVVLAGAWTIALDENPDAVIARRDDAQPQVARRIGEIAGPAEFEIDRALIHGALDAALEIVVRHAWRYFEHVAPDRDLAVAGLPRFGLAVEHDGAVAVDEDDAERQCIQLILAQRFDLSRQVHCVESNRVRPHGAPFRII